MSSPSPQQIIQVRNGARITQTEAAALVYVSLRAWQHWEGGTRKMNPALWEMFNIKLRSGK